ncbi:hypothetical protein B9Z55_020823 [Caenorhabditis nigoni]|uniref:F-box domain-containing protein n=1 Tax=Caenorhabditis nigoni TaxID=1611254 RepID=A0A2G5TPG4_9PELO|nr:hypothetical protein B9Z55_020823 [Caenorhabditis nigoni]
MNCFFDIFRCVSKRRSASLTNLIDLPQLVLEQILENLDFHSILILRKVCHDLRDFIDYIKPSSHLECISIKVESKSIYLDLLFPSGFKSFNGSQFLDIEFHENENGCLSKCKTRRLEKKFLIGQDFVKTAMNYLKVLMKHQKSTLEFFRLEIDYYPNLPREFDRNLEPIAEEVLEGFREILESRRSQIQVEDFQMTVIRQDQVAQILPFVDSKVLQNIEIRGERDNPVASFEIDKLETHAKELKIWMFDVLTPLEKFSRFQKVEVLIQNVTVESILELKEVMFLFCFE